jgi:hypothetical protein
MGEVNESGNFKRLRNNAWCIFGVAIDGAAL